MADFLSDDPVGEAPSILAPEAAPMPTGDAFIDAYFSESLVSSETKSPPILADPDIIACRCGKADCRHQRKWKARLRCEQDIVMALRPDEVDWLRAQGWDGRIP